MKKWQLQEAKNKFSQVAEEAALYGPQVVTRRGEDAVIILSVDEYRKLNRRSGSLASFLLESPLAGTNLSVARERNDSREVDL